MNKIKLKNFEISNTNELILISGPCVIESENHCLMMAEKIAKICDKNNINFVFCIRLFPMPLITLNS